MPDRLSFTASGEGRCLVCLHPIGLGATCWVPLTGRIGPGFRIIAVDLPGSGGSGPRPEGSTLGDDAARVAALLDDLETGPCAVVGVSMGGMVAQELALARPDLVSALVLGACPPGIPEENREALRARGRSALEGGMEAVVDGLIARWFTPGYRDSAPALATRAALLRQSPTDWARGWAAIAGFDRRNAAGRIGCPVLCIAGGADPATPRAAMERLAESVPDGRLEVIDGAPHMLHIETAREFAIAVTRFLAARP